MLLEIKTYCGKTYVNSKDIISILDMPYDSHYRSAIRLRNDQEIYTDMFSQDINAMLEKNQKEDDSDVRDRLISAIMNIQAKENASIEYKLGHRDARHDAVDLVLEILKNN